MLDEPIYRIVFDDRELTSTLQPPYDGDVPPPPEQNYHIEVINNDGETWTRMRPGFSSFRGAENEVKRMAMRSQECIATYDCFGKRIEHWEGYRE